LRKSEGEILERSQTMRHEPTYKGVTPPSTSKTLRRWIYGFPFLYVVLLSHSYPMWT